MSCPYFRRTELRWVRGYCQAYRSGKVRVPTMYELRNLCTTDRYERCPAYRARRDQETAEASCRS